MYDKQNKNNTSKNCVIHHEYGYKLYKPNLELLLSDEKYNIFTFQFLMQNRVVKIEMLLFGGICKIYLY